MKRLFPFLILAEFVLAACNDSHSNEIRSFIPGVYVKEINNEFTVGMDTLDIIVLDYQSGSYTITRKTGYRQTIDGRTLSPRQETHKWIAVYLPESKQLKEQNQGKLFSFAPGKNLLSMGSSQYRKISN